MGIFSSSKKKKSVSSLVIDLQEEAIGVAVVVDNGKDAPIITHAQRSYFDPQQDLSDVLKNTQRLLDATLKNFMHQHMPTIDKVVCVLHPVWYETYIRTATFQQEKQFTVSARMLASLHEKEREDIKSKELRQHDTVFQSHVAGVRINGYAVEQPVQKTKATSVEADIVAYSFHAELQKLFIDSISRYIALPVSFVPFTTVAHTTTRDLFPHTENNLLAMVSAQLTEIAYIQDAGLRKAVNVSLGRHTTVKELSLCLQYDVTKTLSVLSMYDDNDLEEMSASDVSYCLQDIREKYLPKYIEMFVLLSETVLPSTIFITSSSLLDTWFDDLIKDALAAAKKTNPHQIHAILITPHLLHEYCEYAVHAKKDIYLMMAAMYITRFNTHLN